MARCLAVKDKAKGMIDDWTIRQIKERVTCKDVIGDFLQLRRSGTEWTCRCPFHDDHRAGNFMVNERKNMWYCFVCDRGGDAVQFLMDYKGMTYVEALTWMGKKCGIDIEQQTNVEPRREHVKLTIQKKPELQMLVFPMRFPLNYMLLIDDDNLVKWLRSLNWDKSQAERLPRVLRAYLVGHSKDGYTLFWQIDNVARPRTAKMMRYRSDGHRDKEDRYACTWFHSRMDKRLVSDGKGGKTIYYDSDKQERVNTLFGMHILDCYKSATVNLVESEKTAIFCATYFGKPDRAIWMATGGLKALKRETLLPIIEQGRQIVLYPDHDGRADWEAKMKEIGYENMWINTATIDMYWKQQDGEKADFADILSRMMEDERRSNKSEKVGAILRKMVDLNPNIERFIEKFDCEVTDGEERE